MHMMFRAGADTLAGRHEQAAPTQVDAEVVDASGGRCAQHGDAPQAQHSSLSYVGLVLKHRARQRAANCARWILQWAARCRDAGQASGQLP